MVGVNQTKTGTASPGSTHFLLLAAIDCGTLIRLVFSVPLAPLQLFRTHSRYHRQEQNGSFAVKHSLRPLTRSVPTTQAGVLHSGGPPIFREAEYGIGSRDLLDAVQARVRLSIACYKLCLISSV
jgi:hypothetical protein